MKTLAERFEEKYEPEPNTGCWLWTAALDSKGYGVIGTGPHKVDRAHRVSYRLFKGDPTGLDVCHRCDTPACVNPDHLFLGTAKDNIQDMIRKGRKNPAVGERSGAAVLTDKDVCDIRRMYREGGWSHRRLGAHFNVSHTAIGWVLRGNSWRHVE